MRSLSRIGRRLALALALVTALSAALVNPATIAAFAADPNDRPGVSLLRLAMSIVAPGASLLDRITGAQAVSTGSDGRLTFLLLGSDSRGTSIGRTDSIMVVSIKGKAVSMASIPRDTGRIPNPSGGVFSGKVNGLVRSFMLGGMSRDAALARFESVIENLLRIEIDYRAVMWFNGMTTLVGKVDPIVVNIANEIRDPKHVDDPGDERGVYFPKSSFYRLYDFNQTTNADAKRCDGAYKFDTNPPVDEKYWCHRALPFVRSRKGPNNNDWVRAGRQQGFVFAAIRATGSSELSGLVNTASSQGSGKWITNFGVTLANAQNLYDRFQGATLSHRVVFKPTTYATRISGTSAYELKLSAVRAWTSAYMR
jgi:anionic cell wall polymer biosynthesis LytR-Cps2A-Psr (LCP) family protein